MDFQVMDWTSPHGQFAGVLRDLRGVNTRHRLGMAVLMGRNSTVACCTIKNLKDMLFNSTPTDLFAFFPKPRSRLEAYRLCGEYALGLGNVWFLNVENFRTDVDPSLWECSKVGVANCNAWLEYRLMGTFKLAVQTQFLYNLGYKYALQFDDDSRFLEPLKFNLVEFMSKGGYHWGIKRIMRDVDWTTKGIAELTRYFIVTENLVPQQLYDFCSPKNISGLYTGGWNRSVLYGNFIAFSLDFWFEPLHQRFLDLVFSSNGTIRFRWVDQAVMAMMWQLFSGRDKVAVIEGGFHHKELLWCPLGSDK
jgi:hypothetical protein